MEGRQGKQKPPVRIRLGRLAIDPVFLIVFVFFIISSLSIILFILLSSR